MTMGDRIKSLRLKFKMTQEELGKKLGVQKSAVRKWEKGEVENLKRSRIKLMADLFQVSPTYLMGWEEKSNTTSNYTNFCSNEVAIPLYGYVAAGEGYFADNHIEDYIHINPNDFPEGEYYGLTIKGESMTPKMESGDIIIVRKQSYPVNGKFCVMLINGDEATVKRVYVKDDGIHLIALNPSVYEPRIYTKKEIDELPITCLGVVVQIRKNV